MNLLHERNVIHVLLSEEGTLTENSRRNIREFFMIFLTRLCFYQKRKQKQTESVN